jgi:predicted naringenin-chalcone synthase
MSSQPRIVASAVGTPAYDFPQQVLSQELQRRLFGEQFAERADIRDEVGRIDHLFTATRIERRQMSVDLVSYYDDYPMTGQRMADYERLAMPLARQSLEPVLEKSGYDPCEVTDFIVVSCTGHTAPGLDILLARDLGMKPSVRRLIIGHMGCHGAIVGLRSALAVLSAHENAVVALVCVELCSLHFRHTMEMRDVSGFALFADAAAALVLTAHPDASGPELMDVYCAADFATSEQMTWRVSDHGFIMELSNRVPMTLRQNVSDVVEQLLEPHGLYPADVTHWLVHPGGPDILMVIQYMLELSPDQLDFSWQVLRDHGNCSSPTVLLVLDRLLESGQTRRGDWGVMMAFGPGLTLETCLLRF